MLLLLLLLYRKNELTLTKVNFDIQSQDFNDEKVIEEVLRTAVNSGQIGTFYVEPRDFTFRVVSGKNGRVNYQ